MEILTFNLSKEPNFIFTFLLNLTLHSCIPILLVKLPKKTTFVLKSHDSRTRHQVLTLYFFFAQLQLQCDMLLCHTHDIRDLKTQRVSCGDCRPEGCDIRALTH